MSANTEISSTTRNGVTTRVIMSKFNGTMNDDGSALLLVSTLTIKADSAGEEIARSDNAAPIVVTVPAPMASAVLEIVKTEHNKAI